MEKFIRLAVMAGLGLYEKVREGIDELVQKGELSQTEGAALVKELMDKESRTVKDFQGKVEAAMKKTLKQLQPSAIKKELDRLHRIEKKVDQLATRLARLEAVKGKRKG
jgi:polyhydroxyalkanoate synthesis regulator phasin